MLNIDLFIIRHLVMSGGTMRWIMSKEGVIELMKRWWKNAGTDFKASALTAMKKTMEREGVTFDDLGITHAEYETRLKKCKMVGCAKGLWTTANRYNNLGALLSLESGLKSAGLQLSVVGIEQQDYDDLRWHLYCGIARRDLNACRRDPSVVLLDYIPRYLEKVGATLTNIGTDAGEMQELRKRAHLLQAELIWSKLPEWNVCRAHLSSILYNLRAHQELVGPIELEDGQKFPYDFALINTTREEFMELWVKTAPPDPSEMPRTEAHQGALFADKKPPPKKKFHFRRREKSAPPRNARQNTLFPTS